jgi:hypothetical protein
MGFNDDLCSGQSHPGRGNEFVNLVGVPEKTGLMVKPWQKRGMTMFMWWACEGKHSCETHPKGWETRVFVWLLAGGRGLYNPHPKRPVSPVLRWYQGKEDPALHVKEWDITLFVCWGAGERRLWNLC